MLKLAMALAAGGIVLLLLSAFPLGAAAPAAAVVAPVVAPTSAPAATGRALFLAKGCATCHHHADFAGSGALGEGVPDLSTNRWNADFLRRWLADPPAVKPGTTMPNLHLRPDEIDALIAFLTAPKS
jgi:cytochrome c oxidase subunit 2